VSRTLLIDADLLVYRFASVHQHAWPWDESTWSYYGNLDGAWYDLTRWLAWLEKHLDAAQSELFLSDATRNWRHDLYPDYKGQRAAWQAQRNAAAAGGLPPKPGPARPLLYRPLRERMIAELGARFELSLEGDDLVGMAATQGRRDTVVVSSDKDLKTIPGHLYNPDRAERGVVAISRAEADRYHLMQVLAGDRADNYPGCPGLGEKRALALLEREGASWDTVVAAYAKASLTEDDALVQARIARVLRWGDYDGRKHEIRLWTPEDLQV
jgi:DNA polymerase-1